MDSREYEETIARSLRLFAFGRRRIRFRYTYRVLGLLLVTLPYNTCSSSLSLLFIGNSGLETRQVSSFSSSNGLNEFITSTVGHLSFLLHLFSLLSSPFYFRKRKERSNAFTSQRNVRDIALQFLPILTYVICLFLSSYRLK